jgi:mannose-1-phosphate guanylyltransferase
MLLAAGLGTRMEPLSSVVAKPALEVLGQPLLGSALGQLRAAGCAPIVANLHRHPEQVADAIRSVTGSGAWVRFSHEPELLGGAGGVSAARHAFGPGALLVANADVWSELDLAPLLASAGPETTTLALLPHPDPSRWSSVLLDDEGHVSGFLRAGAEPPSTPYLFTGFQLLGAGAVAALPPAPAEWKPWWLERLSGGELRGIVVSGRWCEAGTPMAYRDLVLRELGPHSWTHPTATVSDRATVRRCSVGAGCRIEDGASASDCVITAGACVGPSCALRGCVVAGAVTVGAGEELTDTLVLAGLRTPLSRNGD